MTALLLTDLFTQLRNTVKAKEQKQICVSSPSCRAAEQHGAKRRRILFHTELLWFEAKTKALEINHSFKSFLSSCHHLNY